jgi:hypothetical protein
MSWLITPQLKNKLLLDEYPGAVAAYSLRNLTILSDAPVVRVRRSSDNAEQDFTATQVTDGTLTTFCGAGNGFVRTWYDQSGNNKHAGQATTGNQPQVVSSGSLVTQNSKAALSFNGTSHILNATSATTSQPLSEFLVYTATKNNSPPLGSASSVPALLARRFTGEYIMFAGASVSAGVHGSDQKLAAGFFDGASSQAYWNNSLILSGDPGTGFSLDLVGGNSADRHGGTIQEIIVYQSNQTANRTAIQANINAHYAIY